MTKSRLSLGENFLQCRLCPSTIASMLETWEIQRCTNLQFSSGRDSDRDVARLPNVHFSCIPLIMNACLLTIIDQFVNDEASYSFPDEACRHGSLTVSAAHVFPADSSTLELETSPPIS